MQLRNLFSVMLSLALPIPLAHGEDLWTAYQLAVKRDPVIGQAQAQLAAARENIPLAKAAILPHVDASAGIARHRQDLSGFGPPLSQWYTGNTYSVTLHQPIFNGQSWVALRAARANIRGAQAKLLATQQDLILKLTQAYFGILKAGDDLHIAKSEKARLDRLLRQAQAFLKIGTGEIIAVREAQARVSGAESSLVNAENAYRIAQQQLFRLTQQPVHTFAGLSHFEALGPQPADVNAWVTSAEQNQPLLTAAREQVQVANEQVEIARRAKWPTLDLSGGYVHNTGGFISSIKTDDWYLGLNVAMNLYDGGERNAKTRQAYAQAQANHAQLQDLNDQTRVNVETAFMQLQNSLASLKAVQEQVDSAQISLQATRKGREIGTRTNIDVLNAVQTLADAQRALSDARYQHVLARVNLKYAAGILGESDVRALNAMLSH